MRKPGTHKLYNYFKWCHLGCLKLELTVAPLMIWRPTVIPVDLFSLMETRPGPLFHSGRVYSSICLSLLSGANQSSLQRVNYWWVKFSAGPWLKPFATCSCEEAYEKWAGKQSPVHVRQLSSSTDVQLKGLSREGCRQRPGNTNTTERKRWGDRNGREGKQESGTKT